jgi:hypothetical protein
VHAITVPAGTVLYEGTAAPAHALLAAPDPLAAAAFRGGAPQLLLPAPRALGADSWPRRAAPFAAATAAGPWDILGYDASPLSRAAYAGDLPAEFGPGDVGRPAGRLGFGPLHHACMGRGLDPAQVRGAVRGGRRSRATGLGGPGRYAAIASARNYQRFCAEIWGNLLSHF